MLPRWNPALAVSDFGYQTSITRFKLQISVLSVLGFDPMYFWGWVVLLFVLFSGNPGFTAGRVADPARGDPGGG
ncbi:hypothetical protein F511_22101 [Dorcoceras hygrometricum]|uniref:Uncharacterized protein n=1 Tax=Dorcoceras hygrometricum TaxID=472368 RepID=A0A2Z7BN92_9LAMI|nr:hypothetical protein F511_22101 [Dorcoceras hygrometricum]